jgi:hypothetical protein
MPEEKIWLSKTYRMPMLTAAKMKYKRKSEAREYGMKNLRELIGKYPGRQINEL